MEGSSYLKELEEALEKYENYINTAHPGEVFRQLRDEAERIAELREYFVFEEQAVNERFIFTILHDKVQTGYIVASIDPETCVISFELESPLKRKLSQFELVIGKNYTVELILDDENDFELEPYQAQERLMGVTVIRLLKSIYT